MYLPGQGDAESADNPRAAVGPVCSFARLEVQGFLQGRHQLSRRHWSKYPFLQVC